jgi:hypothetical protein
MLLTLLSSLDAQLQRDSKVSLFGYLVMAGLSESPDRTLPMSDLAVLTADPGRHNGRPDPRPAQPNHLLTRRRTAQPSADDASCTKVGCPA